MKLKTGVRLNGVQPETVLAIMAVDSVYKDFGSDLVVTSICDGKEWRNPKSLHLVGLAFDCRIWDFTPENIGDVVYAISEAVGDEFDVVLEDDHIHVEFDLS